MKIVISNGLHEADYIIKMFKNKKDHLIIINDDESACKYLSRENNIDVIFGKSTKEYDLEIADIKQADIFIALSTNDIDNFVACLMAKQIFGVKKTIARTINPKNVQIFQRLGIDIAISSTYLLAETIENAAIPDAIIKSLSIEQDKIILNEILIKEEYKICNKKITELDFLDEGIISSIYRYPHVIIPKGNTIIKANDKVVIVSTKEASLKIINAIKRV